MKKINYTDQPATKDELVEIIEKTISRLLVANNTLLSAEISRLGKAIGELRTDNGLMREELVEQNIMLREEIVEQGLTITNILRQEMREQGQAIKQEIAEIISESTQEVLQAVA